MTPDRDRESTQRLPMDAQQWCVCQPVNDDAHTNDCCRVFAMQVNTSTYSFGKINFHLSSALFGLVGMCGHIPNVHLVLVPACGESVAFKKTQ